MSIVICKIIYNIAIFSKYLFSFRSLKKEQEDDGWPKRVLFPPQVPDVGEPKQKAPSEKPSAPPLPKEIPESLNVSHTLPAAPSTPLDIGTLRSTSSVESCRGPGCPRKELSMPTLADCPPNASREELSKWWKQSQMEFWKYKKLSSPEAVEY